MAGTALPLVPWPQALERRPGALILTGRIALSKAVLEPVGRALAAALSAATGAPFALATTAARPGDIALALDPALEGEAYRIAVDTTAVVRAGSPRAVALAAATLLQLVSGAGGAAGVPRLSISDAPDCGYRGLMIDVARHWHPPAALEPLVELCRFYKVNHLQLHLTDDQSFTFPSAAFPRLPTAGRSYTRSELEALVGFAEARGVTLVPEIDMPGHAGAAIRAMPELFLATPRHPSTLDFASPESVSALLTLTDEAMALFAPSPSFHMGGDECALGDLHERPSFARAFAREGVKDARGLYTWLVNHVARHVARRGRKLIVWEGFGHGSEPPVSTDVTVMAFESAYHLPDCLVRDGYPVINASWEPLYVVNERRWEPGRIFAWDRFHWTPVDPSSPAFGRGVAVSPTARVLGAQMCAWEQAAERELPSVRRRLAAMSERLWNPRAGRPFADFAARLDACDERLGRLLAGSARH